MIAGRTFDDRGARAIVAPHALKKGLPHSAAFDGVEAALGRKL
jgi:hypothetical protein